MEMIRRGLRVKAIVLLLLFVFLMLCSNFNTCNAARKSKHWRTKRSSSSSSSFAQKKGKSKTKGGSHHHDGNSSKQKPKPDVEYPSPPAPLESSVFNVLDFGAKGDGVTDDTKAFQAAWAASCKVEGSTMIVPSQFEFFVGPISFSGPYCQPNIVFQLDGKIIAPTNPKAWGSGLLQWLEFTKLRGITIRGNGIIEGQGSVWWTNTQFEDDPVAIELSKKMPSIKPTALRFYGSTNVTVTGITIQNSPQCHLKFDNCESVLVYNMTVSSPGDSLNTDGIHLQNSRGVTIHHTDLGCGDDCISIQTGCSNVYIHNVNCGPGHGISIGGLGRDNTKACVSNITVQYINMHDTMNGVRIKTWQVSWASLSLVKLTEILHRQGPGFGGSDKRSCFLCAGRG